MSKDIKQLLLSAKNVYKEDGKHKSIGGGYVIVIDGETLDLYINKAERKAILAIRGTKLKDRNDLVADAKLMSNNLASTKRYITDKEAVAKILSVYPPDEYDYHLSSHSLATAIATQLMRDFPNVFRSSTSFNGAFQLKDLVSQNPNENRLYIDKDFLFRLGGHLFKQKQVFKYRPDRLRRFYNFIRGFTYFPLPSLGDEFKAHQLSNFDKNIL